MNSLDLSNIVCNYTVSVATLFAGIWTFWKWGFSEWLRKKREGPAVDGDLSYRSSEFSGKNSLLITTDVRWRNRSQYPVYIDTKSTRIDLFLLTEETEFGPILTNKDLGEPKYRLKPYEDMNNFMLEPNTESILQHHFILEKENTYLIRWKLYRNASKHSGGLFAWTKESVINLKRNNNEYNDSRS